MIPTLLQVGRRIADSGLKYDPLRVAGEILFIMRSADPRILRYSSPQFSQLIRDLIPIISSHLPSTSLPPEKSYIKRILITCKELNVRLPRLVDYRLEEILERILGELPHGQPLSRTLARKPMGKRLFGTESQRFSTTSEETFQLERLKNAEDSLPASRNPTPQPSTANHETVTPYPSPSFPPFRNPQAETPLDRGKRPRSRSLYRTPTGRQTQVIPPVPPLPSTRSSVDYTDLLLAATLIEPPTGNPSRPPPTAFRQRTPVRHRDRRTSNVFKENHPLDGNEMVVTVPRFPIYEYDD